MKKFRYLIAVLALITALPLLQGCSGQQTTTQTTRTSPDPSDPGTATTTTTTTTDNEPDSVLGSTLHAVGTVILFPFRLVGDAVGLIV